MESKAVNFEDAVVVGNSDIHGKGIFTTVNIPEGAEVMEIRGEVISADECVKREAEGNVYIFWHGEDYIDTAGTPKIKYINHNCGFNCEVVDRDEESLSLIAARDIAAGEELTIDYGYEEIYRYCTCGKCN